ncbi:MAG: cyclic nucleotide-binding domain-containing protein [Nitratireductor sp.]|nr:cyclic nucleotide-binding domain-containing protein [Nitratireductor sp.]
MQTFFDSFVTAFLDPANLPGHFAYVLLIVSMLMRRMVWLRIFAIAAGAFSAIYYTTLGDWVSCFWESLFSLVNAAQLLILFIENRRGKFTSEEQTFIDIALHGLERAHARRLVKLGKWVEVGEDEVLIVEDSTPTHLYFIVNGTARVTRHQRPVGLVGPGDFLGEMSYLTGKHATATVSVLTPMRCLTFEREVLRAHLERNPEVRHAMEGGFNRNLVEKLVKTNTEGLPGLAALTQAEEPPPGEPI